MLKVVLTLLTIIVTSRGYPGGAPISACEDMLPRHATGPQETELPYTVIISANEASSGDQVNITISGGEFLGYLLEVRNSDDETAGYFELSDTDFFSQTLDCYGHNASAITHTSILIKEDLQLNWIAPEEPGTYSVLVTVVQDALNFWDHKEVGTIVIN